MYDPLSTSEPSDNEGDPQPLSSASEKSVDNENPTDSGAAPGGGTESQAHDTNNDVNIQIKSNTDGACSNPGGSSASNDCTPNNECQYVSEDFHVLKYCLFANPSSYRLFTSYSFC